MSNQTTDGMIYTRDMPLYQVSLDLPKRLIIYLVIMTMIMI